MISNSEKYKNPLGMEDKKIAEFRKKLEETTEWPSVYMFKFIIPSDNDKLAEIESLFNTKESSVVVRESSRGTYLSITAKEMMLNADSVVERYIAASKVEGLIMSL